MLKEQNNNIPLVTLDITQYKQRSFVFKDFGDKTIIVNDTYIEKVVEITENQVAIATEWQERFKDKTSTISESIEVARDILQEPLDAMLWVGAFDDIYAYIGSISTMFNVFVHVLTGVKQTIAEYQADDNEILSDFIKDSKKIEKEANQKTEKYQRELSNG